MVRIDGWIITILERFCHWVQRVFGVTSAYLVNACYILASFWFIQEWFLGVNKLAHYFGWLIILSFFLSSRQALKRKDLNRGYGDQATANPLKADTSEIRWRMIGAVISALVFWVDLGTGNFWFEVSVLGQYFAACDDLPIAPSKLKQWLGSFNRQPELQPVESEC